MADLLRALDGLLPYTQAIGFWAGGLTAASFAPQVVQSWRTGGEGLSWFMLMLFGSGVAMWFLFGLLLRSGPVVLANGITGLEVLFLVWLKWRHARTRKRAQA